MGSGPTSYLASIREPHSLILMSPYTSIKNAAKSILGWASFLGFIIIEKFRNIDAIKQAQCPVMLIHGKEDNLIPWSHSEELYDSCNPDVPAVLHMPSKMDHNEFNLEMDLIEPIKDFFNKIKIASRAPKLSLKQLKKKEEKKLRDGDSDGDFDGSSDSDDDYDIGDSKE